MYLICEREDQRLINATKTLSKRGKKSLLDLHLLYIAHQNANKYK
jgi:hypothetical protein